MRRILLNSLVFSSISLLGAGAAMAQAGGQSPGQSPSSPQQSPPSRPTSPDMNGPAGPGGANGPDTTTMTRKVDDKKFVQDAALGGMAEVELGKLATQKASSDAVKQFGQKMVDDHTKANDQLKEIASKENINIPDSLDSKHQSRIEKLSKLSGPDFDKAYVKDQVKDHKKDVSEFKSEAENGSNPNIKQFASTTLPTLQQHLSMAQDLGKNEKKSSAK
jgi:putative membrane protein